MDFLFSDVVVNDENKSPSVSKWNSPSRNANSECRASTVCDTETAVTSRATSLSSRASTACTSVAGTGRTKQQMAEMQLSLEMKDHQIVEMEIALTAIEQEAQFKEGQLRSEMENQAYQLENVRTEHQTLQKTYHAQQDEIHHLTSELEKMQLNMKTLLDLETRKQEIIAATAAEEAKRSAAEEAAKDKERDRRAKIELELLERMEKERLAAQVAIAQAQAAAAAAQAAAAASQAEQLRLQHEHQQKQKKSCTIM